MIFLSSRVSEHLASAEILELLYPVNLMVTGQRSDWESNYVTLKSVTLKTWKRFFLLECDKLFRKSDVFLMNKNYRKFTIFLFEVSRVLVGRLMTRFIEFFSRNLLNVGNRLRSENFSGMFTYFLTVFSRKSNVTFSENAFTKGAKDLSLVPHTFMCLITESRRSSNSNWELSLCSLVTKSWKLRPSCCLYVKPCGKEWFCFVWSYSSPIIWGRQELLSFHHYFLIFGNSVEAFILSPFLYSYVLFFQLGFTQCKA